MDLHKTCEKIPKQTASIQYSGPLQEKKKKNQQTRTIDKGENNDHAGPL